MTCNGFNYHGEDELCEIIPYSLSGLQLIQNATGWKLWLSGMNGYILYNSPGGDLTKAYL